MTNAANDRLNWTITQKAAWIATYNPTGEVLIAHSKSALMSKINEFRQGR